MKKKKTKQDLARLDSLSLQMISHENLYLYANFQLYHQPASTHFLNTKEINCYISR